MESAIEDIGGVSVKDLKVKSGDTVVVTAYTDGSTATTITKKGACAPAAGGEGGNG